MAIQTFVADTILTAAQMNALQGNDYNQTVSTKTASYTLVAADKGTKIVMNSASATTITVNTSLFSAGDTLTILNISTGVCTVTAGTATVSTTGSLALAQNGGGTLYFTSAGVSVFQANGVTASTSGLTLISTTTIGTTVSTVALTNIFSATYDNYLIQMSGGVASATSDGNFTLGATTTGYYSALIYNGYGSGTPVGVVASNTATAGTIWAYSANGFNLEMTLFLPNAAKRTSFVYQSATMTTTGNRWVGGGFVDNATSYTGMTFNTQTGSGHTLTGGTIKVYGLQSS